MTLPLSFPAPKNWQDFEELTKQMAKYRLSGEFDTYGRPGQAQKGVDIYGLDKDHKSTGIQCKHKKTAKPTSKKAYTTITTAVIDEEIILVKDFTPKLEKFIIATTSFRDTNIQDYINKLNIARKKDGLCQVEIWFWEIFEEELNRHTELNRFYYDKILSKFDQYDKDKQILSLLHRALSRPVFNTHFHSENNTDDFLKGISDTQRAFTTGKLYDRDRNLIQSSYPASQMSDSEDRQIIADIENCLQEIRNFTTEHIAHGNIKQNKNFLYIMRDGEFGISKKLNSLRREAIDYLNKLLKKHKLEKIDSLL